MHYYQYLKDMKVISIVSFFVAALFAAPVLSQTQQGYVKTKGRLASDGTVISGSRISGATVQVKGRSAVLSQSNGTFSFPITSQSYYLQSVQKQGYVLTDPEVLSKQYAYSKNPLVLVLETPSQQLDDKLAMEKKIRRTLRRQLQDKEDEIESLKEQQKLTEDEYRRQLQEIYDQQENNEKLISEMADRYSKMDFDEKDEFNRRISSLIIEGKLTEADSLLNTKGNINRRAETLRQHQEANAQAEQEIKKKQKNLEKSKELAQKELEDLAQDCYSKFEIFKMQHQNDSAAYFIEFRANLDSTNIKWALDYGEFIQSYYADYEKAMRIYNKALSITCATVGAESHAAAECHNDISTIYHALADYQEALKQAEEALNINTKLFGELHESIALAYNNIGSNYYEMGDYSKSMEKHQKALEIYIALYGECHKEVARCLCLIGTVYDRLTDYVRAEECYNKSLEIYHNLMIEDHPEIATVKMDMCALYYT